MAERAKDGADETDGGAPGADRGESARRELDRRAFLGGAARAAAGLTLGAAALAGSGCATVTPPADSPQAPSAAPRAPGEKIRIGFIGVGGRGRTLLRHFRERPDVEIVMLCDVKDESLAEAVKICGPEVATTRRHEDVIAREDIDAIVTATPDHWHAIVTIAACKAGKDVYVEKPLSLCVAEGRRMVQAARRHGRIVQMGSQQLSGERYQSARDLVRGGGLGRVTMIRTWNFRQRGGMGWPEPTHPPATIDWDRWIGPRPMVPYREAMCTGAFRHFWDYAGGVLTDWGTHHFHTVLDIMGYDPPTRVSAAGGRYVIDDMTTIPDNISVLYQFPGWTLEYSNRDTNGRAPYASEYGIEILGTEATMYLDRGGYRIYPESDRENPSVTEGTPGRDNWVPPQLDDAHVANFIDCVRSREFPASEVEGGHKATVLSHLGNIALRTGAQIEWDAANERIPNNSDADALLRRTYRAPYLLPDV